ncbi:uncharacterized protein LOC124133435 isoform X2 [Haliotis rufescens]|uniref:uncharacterized protein LOC124133435 isoform X2 n=1 Tax=Haliotis rufescens TaxID=6454 RepID=UPI00201F5D5A|nr:uncharacterized protein LOC124133435 isoform X2 [Haliotis rufescens]
MASDGQVLLTSGQLSLGKTHLLAMLALTFLLFATQTQAKFCTSLKVLKKDVNQYGQTLCTESYQSRCGWFTFKMCTFYEKIPCTKERNDTKVKFKIVTECCKGYKYDDNNITCIRNETEDGTAGVTINTNNDQMNVSQAEELTTKGDPEAARTIQDPDDDDGINISHGAFAAIACACLFIICVTVVIVIHVRKKYYVLNVTQEEIRKSVSVVSDPFLDTHLHNGTGDVQLKEEKEKEAAKSPLELEKMVQA